MNNEGPFSLLRTSISIALDSLESINVKELETPEDMEESERVALSEVAKQFAPLTKHVKNLKRSFQEGGHVDQPNKRTRAKGELPGDIEPKLLDQVYRESVQKFVGTEKFVFGDFLLRVCGAHAMPFALDHALKCAMAGFQDGLTRDMVRTEVIQYEAIAEYAKHDDIDNSLAVVGDALVVNESSTNTTAAVSVYQIIEGNSDAFEADGTQPWFRHMCGILVHIWFALIWRELGESPESNKRKKEAREKLFKPDGPMTPDERQSDRYKSWFKRFEATRTACNHALGAYEVFGSIVILHSGFSYSVFKCGRRGPKLAALVEHMSTTLASDDGNNPMKNNERGHNTLLKHSLRSRSGEDDSALDLLAKIECLADRGFIGPVVAVAPQPQA
ncbi:hypothetical protein BDV93DRAFT_579862 [Ceratobasidium sp. AG-I]|nr:hypothetical protein BDV93DRAFT_579862 [Ceratobasidium sp. AG-I]